ncbi:hypothetical protein HMPREF1544_10135 [Mucor circinelloides 1006PhL]|uniref:Uncharacterized protein n=1 Tax=Mucor circinelloides f. circinelloides (strain 1006PhL) TaxID=1220926 RepID=S2JKM0_MUCC1|nr:hypothetical protein HMPREF1544_10135 [Mucor circinelloides 1006PhL]
MSMLYSNHGNWLKNDEAFGCTFRISVLYDQSRLVCVRYIKNSSRRSRTYESMAAIEARDKQHSSGFIWIDRAFA